ncbi:MAG: hypothetical protein HC824_16325 [Synechococcales cyanobacterium RM1_1_8]|nr:hypothetical protein [Synechococcales cyanobacterium RM1_1_8]
MAMIPAARPVEVRPVEVRPVEVRPVAPVPPRAKQVPLTIRLRLNRRLRKRSPPPPLLQGLL